MKVDPAELELDARAVEGTPGAQGGFIALAVLAAAAGAGAALLLAPDSGSRTRQRVGRGLRGLRGEAAGTIAQLQREIRKRTSHSRREKRIFALAGVLVGAAWPRCSHPRVDPARASCSVAS